MIDFRIPKSSTTDLVNGDYFWALIDSAWPSMDNPDLIERLGHCTPGQRALLVVTLFAREVDNGGLSQFFWNSSGDVAAEVIRGFTRLGDTQKAGLVKQAMDFYGLLDPIQPTDVRRQLIAQKSKAETEQSIEPLNKQLYGERELWPLFRQYVDSHPREFFTDSVDP